MVRSILAVAAVLAATLAAVVGAGPTTAVAAGPPVGDILIDDVGGHVLVTSAAEVKVFDLDGARVGSIAGQTGASALLQRGRKVYVGAAGLRRINEVDLDTLQVVRGWDLPDFGGGTISLADTGDRIWYTAGAYNSGAVGAVDTSAGTVTTFPAISFHGGSPIAASAAPPRIYLADGGDAFAYDVSGPKPVRIPTGFHAPPCSRIMDLDLSVDGAELFAACSQSDPGVVAYDTSDLTRIRFSYRSATTEKRAIVRTGDGRHLVSTSVALGGDPEVDVWAIGVETPRRTLKLGGRNEPGGVTGALAVSHDGTRIYAYTSDAVLHAFDLKPRLVSRSVSSVAPGGTFTLRGSGLADVSSVKLGTRPVTFSATEDVLTVQVPGDLLGTYAITVTNPWGTFEASEGFTMTVRRPGGPADGVWEYDPLSVSGSYTPLVGQFGGDLATDVLWYAPGTVADSMWIGHEGRRGAATFTKTNLAVNGSYRPIVGDFAGDDYDDILWYAPGAATDPLWVSVRGSDDKAAFDTSRTLKVNGTYASTFRLRDFRAGAKDDIFLYAPGPAGDTVLDFAADGSGRYASASRPVNATYRVIAGDWNGDLREDLFFYGPGSAPDTRWTSGSGTGYTARSYSVGGNYTPVNLYDDRDNILWWTSGSGNEVYWKSTATSFQAQWTEPRDEVGVPHAGLRNQAIIVGPRGTGLTFAGSAEGYWYQLTNGHTVPGPGTLPLVGDFDGDARADVLWYGRGAARDELWFTDTSGYRSARDVAAGPGPFKAPAVLPR